VRRADRGDPSLGDDVGMHHTHRTLVVPERGLVVLIGSAGAGKSTFAARHFRPTEVLSSDAFRAMVSDDEADQSATAAAFDVLARVVEHRLRRGRLTVIDATNVTPRNRGGWLRLAGIARRPAVAIVLALPESVCQERNAQRIRVVDPAVVRRHVEGVRRSVADPGLLLEEGFAAVHVLNDADSTDQVVVLRDGSLAPPAESVTRPREPRARRA